MSGNSPVRQIGPVTIGHVAAWGADGDLIDGGTPPSVGSVGYSQPAFHVEAPSPTATTSTGYRTMGLGLQFTPATSGQAIFTLDGQIGNTTNNARTDVTLVAGVGSAPGNGVLLAATNGQQLGQPARFVAPGAGDYVPFSQTVLLANLIAGTLYWVDAGARVDSGTSILTELEITGFILVELPGGS